MKLLLIEDNHNISEGLSFALNEQGYTLMLKDNIEEGTNYLNSNNVDLIILDVMLPDGSGFDFYQKVILNKNVPTIFLTAIDDEDEIVKYLNLGPLII